MWIDLANSPQVRFFVPIAEALDREGVAVTVTVRDFAQTVELARRHFPAAEVVGGWGRGSAAKSAAVASRGARLARFASGRRLALALSHNSYAQILAARLLGMPAVTAMDYEHQPANHLAFRLASLVLVPDVFPDAALARFGARHVRRYPGIKEEIYVRAAPASAELRADLGAGDRTLVLLRPPPDFAAYHRFDNPLFRAAVDRVAAADDVLGVLLPRTPEQRTWARQRVGPNVTVTEKVYDGDTLLATADVLIGAGGTMNREAALLGVRTYSLFAGSPAAVDAFLVGRGLLHLVRAAADVDDICLDKRQPSPLPDRPGAGRGLETMIDAVLGRLDRR